MSIRWMPLMGEFDVTPEHIIFKGKAIDVPASPGQAAQSLASVGIILSDQKMVDGLLKGRIQFAEVTPQTVCEFIIGYDLKSKGQTTAGLGGSSSMFSVREWTPPSQSLAAGAWVNHELTGNLANLKPNVPYEVAVRVHGSSVLLEVDHVQVASATLPSAPTQSRQVGIFCVSRDLITISGFTAEVARPQVFIVMQFSSPYNEVYAHVIKDLCDEFGVDAVRADEIYGATSIIIRDVIDRISRSQIVIADISPTNPNVYFEVGYALALAKPIILLAQRRGPESPLPFDVSSFRVLFYDDSIGGKEKLEQGLRNHLQEILGQRQ